MIPIRAELMLDGKIVKEARSRWDWTLSDPGGSIHPIRSILVQTMPMDRRCICQFVRHIDQDSISLIDSDKWTRELSIEDEHGTDNAWGIVSAWSAGNVGLRGGSPSGAA